MLWLLLVALAIIVVAHPLVARQSRLSSGVALVHSAPQVERFLQNPGIGYVQAYMRFGADMPDDVIIVIDQEMIEGVKNPRFIKGGDWMSLVGVQRGGGVWIVTGTEDTMKGKPSSERNWKIEDLKTRLEPDIWYRLRIETDFANRHFKNFTIEGGRIS